MRHYPGESIETLRKMATALAMQSIFGRDALRRSSLRAGGKNNMDSLDKEKLDYMKSAVRSRVQIFHLWLLKLFGTNAGMQLAKVVKL